MQELLSGVCLFRASACPYFLIFSVPFSFLSLVHRNAGTPFFFLSASLLRHGGV